MQKVYLKEDYREVVAGGPVRHVVYEPGDPPKYFVEVTSGEAALLDKIGMAVKPGTDPAAPEAKPESVPQVAEADASPSAAPGNWPAQFMCPVHKRIHKAGSAAYVGCIDAYLAETVPKEK